MSAEVSTGETKNFRCAQIAQVGAEGRCKDTPAPVLRELRRNVRATLHRTCSESGGNGVPPSRANINRRLIQQRG